MRGLVKGRGDTSLRDALAEYITEQNDDECGTAAHERVLISNILNLRDMTVTDVMIPRADIAAISLDTTREDLLSLLAEKQFSRLPVYKETLDDIIGTIHIKDILASIATGKDMVIKDIIRNVPIVSPAMPVLDLLLMMKQKRRHMAMVIDEFGGIDGLVTIGDVIEAIVGEIEDEYDQDDQPQIKEKEDGSVIVDARYDIEEFEEKYGELLDEDEREDVDTLGGLVFSIAGRVPARGEILTHDSGMVFEILDADPRRVHRVLIRNIPLPSARIAD
ncbi:MAG: HlyC/CorC family transporter [Rhodospirillales bacterium]|nr:HlyC/CorC family transporter [Rhodospirillales bacterium]